ncbi:MAG: PIN domain-containing protein [Acidobacteriota bacterium]|nr:PIN domain-containing protein [Acidobacteriota bacterium]
MKEIFADTSHFVAVFHPSDQLHEKAVTVEKSLIETRIITTDFVLIEVLNYFSDFREYFKTRIARAVETIISKSEIQIVECSREEFLKGFEFYNLRLDKGFSLTDCVSMNVMRERNIGEILTNDDHFEQEGFRILL